MLLPFAAPPLAAPEPAAPAGPASNARIEELEQRVRALETHIELSERAHEQDDEKLSWLRMFHLSGFVQGQLVWQWFNAAASPNATGGSLPPGINPNDVVATGAASGTTTNPDFFRLRRARLKTELAPSGYARFVFEIDPTPPGGIYPGNGTILRQTEAQGIIHWTPGLTTELAVGIFKVPFGAEVQEYDPDRPFIERSWGTQNMFPGEFDTGLRAYTSAFDRRLVVQAAVLNGVTEGEPTFSLQPDLNKGKDIVGRAAYNLGPFGAGISGYYGQGQNVSATLLEFKQFPRWAANIDLALHHTFSESLGETRVLAEGTLAQDMDRGVFYPFAVPAIPSPISLNVTKLNERSAWARVEQDVGDWLTLGFRYDYYTPDASQANNARNTYAVVGVLHFTKGLQYMAELDYAIDNVHAPGATSPGKHIETLSNVLQARF